MSINSWTCQSEVICLLIVDMYRHVRSDVSINSWTCQSEVICLLMWTCQSEVICLLIRGHVRVK